MNPESALISAVCTNKDIGVVLSANPDELFITHQDVWDHIKQYYIMYKTTPSLDQLELKFKNFSGNDVDAPTKYYLDELVADYRYSQVRRLITTAADKIADDDALAALSVLSDGTAQINRITATVHDLNIIDVDESIAYFEQHRQQQAQGITTGLQGFDVCMPSGLGPGMLTIMLAFPSIGKSWLALYMAVQAWRQGKTPMIISLEMTEHEVRNRLYAIIGDGTWSHRALMRGEVDLDQYKQWAAAEFADKPNFHVISTEGLGEVTPNVVQGKIDQYKPDFVVIDYLQLMAANKPTESEVVRVKQISRDMKLLAITQHVPMVLIASATPDDNTQMSAPPQLRQVAWSKQIAYDADVVLALGRELTDTVMECAFRKNRHGPLGDFALECDFDRGKFGYVALEAVN